MACLALVSCFDVESPVDERLLLIFETDGELNVRLSVELRHPEEDRESRLKKRLLDLEDQLLTGFDPWSRRFAEADSGFASFYWEKKDGRLVYVERNLLLDDPRDLSRILEDTALRSSYEVVDDIAELRLYPGIPGRATRRERREMAEALEGWCQALEEYFAAAQRLYRYLERQPERAEAAFTAIFEVEHESDDTTKELTAEEDELVEAFSDTSAGVLAVLVVDQEEGYSLEELSRRVYDPFPARLEVELPAPAREVDGFVAEGERWIAPTVSLWSTLEELEGEWLEPDPLLAFVEHELSGSAEPIDIGDLVAKPRYATAPDDDEIADLIETLLTPRDTYRLSWPSG